jgi:hypothetical protein
VPNIKKILATAQVSVNTGINIYLAFFYGSTTQIRRSVKSIFQDRFVYPAVYRYFSYELPVE